MLKFTTTTPINIEENILAMAQIHPLVLPSADCKLKEGILKGKNSYIVGRALALAGFYLPCFFDGDITELDKPNGSVFMILPSGTYKIKVFIDSNLNYLLDLA